MSLPIYLQNTSIHQDDSIGQSCVSKMDMLLRDNTKCRWLNYFFSWLYLVSACRDGKFIVCMS